MATKIVKEIVTDVGGNVSVEYSDDSTAKFNIADTVTAVTNPVTGGISINGRTFVSGAAPSSTADATSNTSKIQVALNSAGEVEFLDEGVFYINSTLIIGSNTSFKLGSNTTIKLVDGLTNTHMIRNADISGGNTNIKISGGTWDGSGSTQVRDDASGTFSALCIYMQRVSSLKLGAFKLIDPVAWGVTINSCTAFVIDDIELAYTLTLPNMDGIHLCGSCENGTVRKIFGRTYDDLVAIVTEDYGIYAASTPAGSMKNITIEDVKSYDASYSYRMVRLLDTTANPAINITVRNVKGKYLVGGIFLGTIGGSSSSLKGILLDDIDIEPVNNTSGVPTIELQNNFYDVTIRALRRRIRAGETAQPVIGATGTTLVMRNLTIQGMEVTDDSTTAPAYIQLDSSGGNLYNLSLSDIKVLRSGATGGNLINNGRTIVGSIHISNLATQRISRLWYGDQATGQCLKLSIANFSVQNPNNAIIQTAAAATVGAVQLLNGKLTGTVSANGAIRFSGLTGSALIDITNCDLQMGANAVLTRAGAESIRVRSICSPVNSALLTPSRGDLILDSAASNDPKRYDGAAWVAL